MGELIKLAENPKVMIGSIRRIIKDSSNVNFITHKFLDGILMSQVWLCLEKGTISSGPVMDEHDNPHCELTHMVAGRNVRVALSITYEGNKRELNVLHVSEE